MQPPPDRTQKPGGISAKHQFIDPKALMAIRNLELRARAVVQGFWNGLHRSPRHGFSVEFTEYRQYTPGDDPRFLDWRVFARSDRFYIKRFREETNRRCLLLADNSRSMTYGSDGWNKAEYANTLAGTLAYFLHLQGDPVGLLSFDERVREYLPPRLRTGHLRRVMLALEKPAGGAQTDLASPLQRVAELVRKRSLLILISDLLAPLAKLQPLLTHLAASGHELMIFQVLDPAEVRFQFTQATLFEDLESRREIYLDPGAVRAAYLAKLATHNDTIRRGCEKLGVHYARFTTDQPLETVLFDFLHARARRSTRSLRATSGPKRSIAAA
jgi:uncharacterized protein (DUF58 family)